MNNIRFFNSEESQTLFNYVAENVKILQSDTKIMEIFQKIIIPIFALNFIIFMKNSEDPNLIYSMIAIFISSIITLAIILPIVYFILKKFNDHERLEAFNFLNNLKSTGEIDNLISFIDKRRESIQSIKMIGNIPDNELSNINELIWNDEYPYIGPLRWLVRDLKEIEIVINILQELFETESEFSKVS